MSKLLVIDDEPSISWGLTQLAERMGLETSSASSAEEGISVCKDFVPDVIVTDVRLPGIDGLQAIPQLQEHSPHAKIIVITAFGELDIAIRAVQSGAFEYLLKPFDMDSVERILKRALSEGQARKTVAPPPSVGGLVGSSHLMQEAFKQIAFAANSDAPILILGESGTGKELAARAIHEHSDRANGPLVTVNVASLSESLAESELFGHVQGAFTDARQERIGYLQLADQGTLFLDEVAEIPLTLQVKLLRALETGEFFPVGSKEPIRSRFRIISATHQSILERIQSGAFRHDLYFRLAAFQIMMPSLRERPEDIPLLAHHFLNEISKREKNRNTSIDADVLEELQKRAWAGNVRELRNAMEHACIVSRGGTIGLDHLPPAVPTEILHGAEIADVQARLIELVERWTHQELEGQKANEESLYDEFLGVVEPPLLKTVLAANQGQYVSAAKRLGLHRSTLKKKAEQYELER